jgi:uncharacterized membrane protein
MILPPGLAVTFLSTGLLLIVVAIPLILGRVPMNRWYGVRIRKAFESERNWYEINRYGGKWLVAVGAAVALLGLVFWPAGRLEAPWIVWLALAVPLVIAIPFLVLVLRFARRLPASGKDSRPAR